MKVEIYTCDICKREINTSAIDSAEPGKDLKLAFFSLPEVYGARILIKIISESGAIHFHPTCITNRANEILKKHYSRETR